MAETRLLDELYHYILTTLVEKGQAPHYTEIARTFSVTPEEGKALQHDLIATGVPGWLHPDTELLASLGPSTICPPITALRWTDSSAGSANEDLNRWRSAGCFQENPF